MWRSIGAQEACDPCCRRRSWSGHSLLQGIITRKGSINISSCRHFPELLERLDQSQPRSFVRGSLSDAHHSKATSCWMATRYSRPLTGEELVLGLMHQKRVTYRRRTTTAVSQILKRFAKILGDDRWITALEVRAIFTQVNGSCPALHPRFVQRDHLYTCSRLAFAEWMCH